MPPGPHETPLQTWERIKHQLARELQQQMGKDFQAISDALKHHGEGQKLIEEAARPAENRPQQPPRQTPPQGRTGA